MYVFAFYPFVEGLCWLGWSGVVWFWGLGMVGGGVMVVVGVLLASCVVNWYVCV
jgi:prepilin signal peptidase PulO-like enzyme (type II secretory pathway)